MKNIITLLLCLITISVYAQADEGVPNQTDAHIFGHVLDKKNAGTPSFRDHKNKRNYDSHHN